MRFPLIFAAVFSLAACAAPAPDGRPPEHGYGAQLMTPQEHAEFRAKMQGARTVEEREKIRREHHEVMKERAKARGIVLPDEPPMKGMGPRGYYGY